MLMDKREVGDISTTALEEQSVTPKKLKLSFHECVECGATFQKRAYLLQHELSHQDVKGFQCEYVGCDKAYTRKDHLTRHTKTAHEALTKEHKCHLCGAEYAYKHGLTRHIARSHENKNLPYICTVCKLAFKKKSQLQAHSFVHTGIVPFSCTDCNQSFMKKCLLTKHRQIHESKASITVFPCIDSNCQYIFSSSLDLLKHLKSVHESKSSSNPTTQLQQPVESTALKCPICAIELKHKKNLRKHLQTHEHPSSRETYACHFPECGKTYTCQSNLIQHKVVHHHSYDQSSSQEFFHCHYDDCGQTFQYKHVLRKHIQNVHEKIASESDREKQPRMLSDEKIRSKILGSSNVGVVIVSHTSCKDENVAKNNDLDQVTSSEEVVKECQANEMIDIPHDFLEIPDTDLDQSLQDTADIDWFCI